MYFSRKLYVLAFEYFISRKTLRSVVQGKKVSKPIVRISVISIILAVVVNLITIAVVTGFQQEVRQKVSGFGSHIFIMSASESSVYEADPIRKDQNFLKSIISNPEVKSLYEVGYKPVLFQSDKNEITYKLPSGKDTSETHQTVQGAIIKGIGSDYDLSFFEQYLIDGALPTFHDDTLSTTVLISQKLAKDLHFKVGDTVDAFFVRNAPVKRKFNICGIYDTGLEEFDKKIVVGDLKYVQKLNDWGITSQIEVEDSLYQGQLILRANISGGNGNYRCDWGEGFEPHTRIPYCPLEDTVIRLVASDYWSNLNASFNETSLPDTSYIKITCKGTAYSPCDFQLNELDELDREYLNESGSKFALKASQKTVEIEITPGKGSYENYVGGFEIALHDWDNLDAVADEIRKKIEFVPSPYDELLKVVSVKESESDIFTWLGFLDVNVFIILLLMILIGIINMGSALLVLILIRTNFIGLLKAMGATNWSIRKIFLIQAAHLIGRGMLWGNVIGLAICFIQNKFGVMSLNPEVYYLNAVPIELHWYHWVLLNVGTLVVCLVALLLPSAVISRINPVKAIKFN